jgi:RimJ/RimL family protein N-acetyltransferase
MISRNLGEGLVLTPLDPSHAEELAAFVDTERAHLAPWLPWATTVTDADSAGAFLQRYADGAATDSRYLFALRAEGTLIGGTMFRTFDPAAGVCEVGVWLAAEAQGRGAIGRVVPEMLDWALLERGLHRAEWRCVPENTASRAVAQRLGMRLDGRLRETWQHAGRWWDLEVWSVLADEWRATRP